MRFSNFCILLISLISTSCATYYYGNGNIATMTSFVPKPAFESDSTKIHHIIGGSYYKSVGNSVYVKEDQNTFGELSYTIAHSFDNHRFGYKFIGYYGEYTVNSFEKTSSLNGGYSYGGIGAIFDYSWVISLDNENVELRFFGVRFTALKEYGEFGEFREGLDTLGGFIWNKYEDLNPNGMSFTVGGTNEVVIRSKKNQYGFYHTLGYTPMLNYHYGASLYARFNDLLYLTLNYHTHSYGYGMLGLGCSFVVK